MQLHFSQPRSGRKGFTLIESIIYIALYSIIMGGVVVAVYAIYESAGRNQTKAMIEEEGNFLVGKINWVLSGVKLINIPIVSATSTGLSVTTYNDTVVTFTVTPAGILMMRSASTSFPLNNTNTEVSMLEFAHLGTTTSDGLIPEGVRASFTVSARTPSGMRYSQHFLLTRFLRK